MSEPATAAAVGLRRSAGAGPLGGPLAAGRSRRAARGGPLGLNTTVEGGRRSSSSSSSVLKNSSWKKIMGPPISAIS